MIRSGFAVYTSIIGDIKYYYEEDMLIEIEIMEKKGANHGVPNRITDMANMQMQEYLRGERKKFDLPLKLVGTEFQKRVWSALRDIPYGETRSYKQIAAAIGNEKACRAVGMANNKNPFIIVLPCHRVLGSNGSLVGYAKGIELKKYLLELEAKNNNIIDSI